MNSKIENFSTFFCHSFALYTYNSLKTLMPPSKVDVKTLNLLIISDWQCKLTTLSVIIFKKLVETKVTARSNKKHCELSNNGWASELFH